MLLIGGERLETNELRRRRSLWRELTAPEARSLRRDLHERGLGESHDVRRMALFDHFPFSKYCEVAVWLEMKKG